MNSPRLRRMPTPSLIALVLLGFGGVSGSLVPTATAQVSGEEDPDQDRRALERFGEYLQRKPFHTQGFERYFAAAVELNALGVLIGELEEQVAQSAASDAQRVVLARLYARTERGAEARALLDAVQASVDADSSAPSSANAIFTRDLRRLRAELTIAGGEVEAGLAELDVLASSEAEATSSGHDGRDPRELEALHTLRAETALRLGDRDRAKRAFEDLAAVNPNDFDLALEVASLLARANLTDAATARYGEALTLAGDDAPRRCRALAALGELHERSGSTEAALAAYQSALEWLAYGHWLERQLSERVLAVHTRTGTLEQLSRSLAARLAERPDDLSTRVLLAHAQLAQKQVGLACATLARATEDLPRNLALGREYVAFLELAQNDEARVLELQRLIDEHPNELELYIELGQVLATSGRLAGAEAQWRRSLERRLDDPGLCVRLAKLHAHHGLVDGAIELLERALTLDPHDLGLYDEWARVLTVADRRDAIPAVLDRAEAAAGDDPLRLELLAQIAGGYRDRARAGRALERAVAGAPTEPRLLRALAEHASATGDLERASALLHESVVHATDVATKREAGRRLLRLHRENPERLLSQEEARLAVAPDDTAALWIGALVTESRGRLEEAVQFIDRLLEVQPAAEHALLFAASLDEQLGLDTSAVGRYRALIEQRPAQKGRWLGELAKLQLRLEDEAGAVATLEESLRLAPDNPAVFAAVAQTFSALGDERRARECLRQVLRLRPDDGRAQLDLAARLARAPRHEEPRGRELAEELARQATRNADLDVVTSARAWIYQRLDERGEVGKAIARLRDEARANPFDKELGLELIDLLTRDGELELALESLDELLSFSPSDVALLRERARTLTDLRRFEAAAADYETLLGLPDQEGDDLRVRCAELYARLGDLGRAESVARPISDRLAVANLYRRQGLLEHALPILTEAHERSPGDAAILDRLLGLQLERRDLDGALIALDRLTELSSDVTMLLRRRAELCGLQGDTVGRREALVASLLSIAPMRGPSGAAAESRTSSARRVLRTEQGRVYRAVDQLREWVVDTQGGREWMQIVAAAAQREPLREELATQAFASVMHERDFALANALLAQSRAALAAGQVPVGLTEARWKRRLDQREAVLDRNDPVRVAARAEVLAAQLATASGEGALTSRRVRELHWLYYEQGDVAAQIQLLERAVEVAPDDVRSRAGLARIYLEARHPEAAIEHLRLLAVDTWLRKASGPKPPNRRDTREVTAGQPAQLAELCDDALLVRRRRLNAPVGFDGEWSVMALPKREDTRLALVRALGDVGDFAGAEVALRDLEPEFPDHLPRAVFVVGIARELGLEAVARRITAQVFEILDEVERHPLLRRVAEFDESTQRFVLDHAPRLVALGDDVGAYELIRRWSSARDAAAFLRARPDLAPLRAELEGRWRAVTARDGSQDAESVVDERALEVDRVRERACMLLDVLIEERDWRAAVGVVDEVSASHGLWLLGEHIATRLLYQAGEVATTRARLIHALEAHRARAFPRRTPREDEPLGIGGGGSGSRPVVTPFDLPSPLLPGILQSSSDVGSALWFLADSAAYESADGDADELAVQLEADLALLEYSSGDWPAFTAHVERLLARLDAQQRGAVMNLAWALAALSPSSEALDLLTRLHAFDGSSWDIVAAYGRALERIDRSADARRLYEDSLQDHREEASAALAGLADLEAHGVAAASPPAAPEDLSEAVANDPKNVGLRTRYVEQLLAEQSYAAAAVEARVLADLAPHRDEAQQIVERALLLAGLDDELVERLRARWPSLQSDFARLWSALRIAANLYHDGDVAGAAAFLSEVHASLAPRCELTSAGFWLARGEYERALAELNRVRGILEEASSWRLQSIDPLSARIRARLGARDLAEPDDTHRAERVTTFWGRQRANTRVDRTLLRGLQSVFDSRERAAAADTIEAHAANLVGAQAELTLAVACWARGDLEGFEERLVSLSLTVEGDWTLALEAVASAFSRGALERALELLERTQAELRPSRRESLATALGPLDEATAVELQASALQWSLAEMQRDGEPDPAARERALRRWRTALVDDPATLLLLTEAAGFDRAAANALEVLGSKLTALASGELTAELPEATLKAALRLLLRTDRTPEAFALLFALESRATQPWRFEVMLDLARELGQTAALRDFAVEHRVWALRDPSAARRLLGLVAEVDGVLAAFELAAESTASGADFERLWVDLAREARRHSLEAEDGATRSSFREWEVHFLERGADSLEPWDGTFWAEIARALVDGDVERARATVRAIDEDRRAMLATHGAPRLHAAGHETFALEVLEQLPASERPLQLEIELLLGLGRVGDAYTRLADARGARAEECAAVLTAETRARLRATAEHAAALRSRRRAVADAGASLARSAALEELAFVEHIEFGSTQDALPTLRELRSARPSDDVAHRWFLDALIANGLAAEALRELERYTDLQSRIAVDKGAHNRKLVESATALHARLTHDLHGDAGLLESLRNGVAPRYAPLASDELDVDDVRYALGSTNPGALAWRHGLAAAAYTEFGHGPLARARWEQDTPITFLRAAARAGDAETAMQMALEGLRDDPKALGPEIASIFGQLGELARLETELTRWLDEVEADAASSSSSRAIAHETVARARLEIAAQRGEFAQSWRRAEAQCLERAWDPGAFCRTAEAALFAGESIAGLAAARQAATLRASSLFEVQGPCTSLDQSPWRPSTLLLSGLGHVPEKEKFQDVLGVGGGGGRVTIVRDRNAIVDRGKRLTASSGRDLRVELAYLTGDVPLARRLEAARLEAYADIVESQGISPTLRVARDYMRYGLAPLDAEAERLLVDEAPHDSVHGAAAYHTELVELRAELARRRGDLAAAEWLLDEALRLRGSPDGPAQQVLRGWIALDAGDAADALRRFVDAERTLALRGEWDSLPASHAHGLAQARAAVHGFDDARIELRRALAEHPWSPHATRTRTLLGPID